MQIRKYLMLGVLLGALWPVHAANVAGVKLEDTTVVEGTPLVLNGAGVRTRMFVKVYVAALYTPQKSKQASSVVQVTAPRRVVLWMMRGVDAETLSEAMEEGVRNNSSATELAGVKPGLDDLTSQMRKLGKLNEADLVVLDLVSNGVRVSVNGKPVAHVTSASLASAVLRIWLGEQPVDGSLKTALLAG